MASQAYFVDAEGIGNMHYATQNTQPAQSPATHPDKWAQILIPARARSYLRLAAAQHIRRSNGELEVAAALAAMSQRELHEIMRVTARERISFTLPMRVVA